MKNLQRENELAGCFPRGLLYQLVQWVTKCNFKWVFQPHFKSKRRETADNNSEYKLISHSTINLDYLVAGFITGSTISGGATC